MFSIIFLILSAASIRISSRISKSNSSCMVRISFIPEPRRFVFIMAVFIISASRLWMGMFMAALSLSEIIFWLSDLSNHLLRPFLFSTNPFSAEKSLVSSCHFFMVGKVSKYFFMKIAASFWLTPDISLKALGPIP